MLKRGEVYRNVFLLFLVLSNLFIVSRLLPDEVWGVNETDFMIRTVMSSYAGKDSLYLSIEQTEHTPLYFYLQKIISSIFDYHRWSFFIIPVIISCLAAVLLFLTIEKVYSREAAYLITPLLSFSVLHFAYTLEVEENAFFGVFLLLVLYLFMSTLKESPDTRYSFCEISFYVVFFLLGFTHNYFLYVYGVLILFLLMRTLLSWVSVHKAFHQSKRLLSNTIITGAIPVFFLLGHVDHYANSTIYFVVDQFSFKYFSMLFDIENFFWRMFINVPTMHSQGVLPFVDGRYAFVMCFILLLFAVTCVFFIKDVYTRIRDVRKKKARQEISSVDELFFPFFFLIIYGVMMFFVVTHGKDHTFYYMYLLFFLAAAYGVFRLYGILSSHKIFMSTVFIAALIIYSGCTYSWMHMDEYRDEVSPSVEPYFFRAEELTGRPVSEMQLYANVYSFWESYAVLNDRRIDPEEARQMFAYDLQTSFEVYAQRYQADTPVLIVSGFCGEFFESVNFNESGFPEKLAKTHVLLDKDCTEACICGYIYKPIT